jgi:hypothetical protein
MPDYFAVRAPSHVKSAVRPVKTRRQGLIAKWKSRAQGCSFAAMLKDLPFSVRLGMAVGLCAVICISLGLVLQTVGS